LKVLVIGCGNLLRGDDAAGPVLVRRMWDRGLPDGVRCADGGTGGMDVAFQMRGVPQVILIDACSSGSEPGTLFEVPGHEVENLPPLTGINLHAFRWDHAIAFGHWLLKDEYPENVTAYLIEGERYEIGEGLSPAVDKAVDRLVDLLLHQLGPESAEAAAATTLPRPQPVGVFPFPRSHLLAAGGDEAIRAAAVLGDEAAAAAILPASLAEVTGDTPLARHNRFVLAPSPEALAAIRAEGDPAYTSLAEAAAFAHGLVDELTEPGPLDGELKALVQMTAAAGLFERGDHRAARSLLVEAAAAAEGSSPTFAALLEKQIAESLPAEAMSLAIDHLHRAEHLAATTRLPRLRADISMRLGTLHQSLGSDGSRGPLAEAVNCYQKALTEGITQESDPGCYSQLQNNLGLAYLCMPTREASDKLRTGIAVQSFRTALEVLDRETDPDMWASVTMNLASALQYLPSTHPAENLAEAVELYEQVLEVRAEPRDPVAHARVLLNQGNALAHLGIFKPALEKLAKAYKLFSWHEAVDEAATARELLDRIQARDSSSASTTSGSPTA
jgi:hydrogenase maturation protease